MTFDFSQLSGTDFAFGLFGASLVEIYRLKRLLDKNDGRLKASKLQVLLNFVCFLSFIFGSGVLAATQGVSPEFSALYAGLTFPVFFSVILRDNAEAEKELVRGAVHEKNSEIYELKKHMRMMLERFGGEIDSDLALKIAASVEPEKFYTIGTPDSMTYHAVEGSRGKLPGQQWISRTSRRMPAATDHDNSKLISLRSTLISAFLIFAVLGVLIYLQAMWLIALSPVLLCIFILIRSSGWLQKFFSGLF